MLSTTVQRTGSNGSNNSNGVEMMEACDPTPLGQTASFVDVKSESKKDLPTPRLGSVYQTMLWILAMIAPTLNGIYAYSLNDKYFSACTALYPFSVACHLLLFMSSPSEQEKTQSLLLATFGILITAFAVLGQLRTNVPYFGSLIFLICFLLSCFKFMLPLRRKLGKQPIEKLRLYVNSTIFKEGIASLPPMLYLSVESMKCISENLDYEGDINDKCGAVIWPQYSLCFMLLIFLVFRLFIAPLTNTTITVNDIVLFTPLSLKLKVQMMGAKLAGLCNICLFALMEEEGGPKTQIMTGLSLTSRFALCAVCASEAIHIIKQKRAASNGNSDRDSVFEVLNAAERAHTSSIVLNVV